MANSQKTRQSGEAADAGAIGRELVARAFLKNAPILILDEPTSAIDSKTESVILDALDPMSDHALHAAGEDLTGRLGRMGSDVRIAGRMIARDTQVTGSIDNWSGADADF